MGVNQERQLSAFPLWITAEGLLAYATQCRRTLPARITRRVTVNDTEEHEARLFLRKLAANRV